MNDNVYIHAFSLPSTNAESGFFVYRDERMYDTLYPFQIFPYKQLRTIEFAPITIFCGGNGSGKTTLLNVIAQALEIKRHTPFSSSALFGEYVSLCKAEHRRIPENSLSFENQEKLSQFLLDSARFYGCQFILSTHSPVLLPNVRQGFDFFERHRAEFL